MTRVTELYKSRPNSPIIIADFSPPRGATTGFLEEARLIAADFISVAYNPAKSVRADPVAVAYTIKQQTGIDVIFNLAARDMNRMAIQSHLLGAALLGLENVVVVKGDDFSEKDLALVKEVNDYKTTELISAIMAMNQGVDYRGLRLRAPTAFCVGAGLDLSRDVEREIRLAQKKAAAGASFFLTQTVWDPDQAVQFLKRYESAINSSPPPVFFGVQVLVKDGVMFGDIPDSTRRAVENGKSGADIALEVAHGLLERGIRTFYLIPPILKGGARDCSIAQKVIENIRR